MTTALEQWGNGQEESAHDDAPVHEDDISGAAAASAFDEHAEVETHDALEQQAVAAEDAESQARRAKMAKQMRLFYAAGGAAALVIVGVVGLKVMGAGGHPQPVAQPMELQAGPRPSPLAGAGAQAAPEVVIAPVGAAQGTAASIITERQDGSPVQAPGVMPAAVLPTAPNFGLQQPGMPPQPPVVPAIGVAAIQQGPAVVPAPSTGPVPSLNPSPLSQPAAAPNVAPTVPAALPGGAQTQLSTKDGSTVELEKLRGELATLRTELGVKTASVDELRSQVEALKGQVNVRPTRAASVAPAPARSPARPVAKAEPKHGAATQPPASGIRETVAPIAVAVASPDKALAKGKVRSDFRIYASVDGRVWVLGPDGEPTQIGPRSPLSDGSRVTSIDTEKNVVFTTAGEIR